MTLSDDTQRLRDATRELGRTVGDATGVRQLSAWLDRIGQRNADRTHAWLKRRYGDREWWKDSR